MWGFNRREGRKPWWTTATGTWVFPDGSIFVWPDPSDFPAIATAGPAFSEHDTADTNDRQARTTTPETTDAQHSDPLGAAGPGARRRHRPRRGHDRQAPQPQHAA